MDRVPSLCSSSPPAARETFLLEIFSLMALAISIILRNKHTKQGRVSSMQCSGKLGRQEREAHLCSMPQRQNPRGGHRSKAPSRGQQDR